MKKAKKQATVARRAVVRKAAVARKPVKHAKTKAHVAKRAPQKKAARQAKPDAATKKLWLAKPHEKDPSLEEDWHSDLDDEMDFEETSGVREE